ncbi:MAG: holin family protein [Bariatricus sp.]
MKKMEKLFNWISIVFGFVGGLFSYWLGGWDILLKTIVFLAVVDYITGLIKAVYLKQLSSEIGFKGLLKKIVMFIVIAVAFVIQQLIGGTVPLREVVIMFYIANEALSLLENAAIFIPIPDKLRDVLLQLRDKDTDSEGE